MNLFSDTPLLKSMLVLNVAALLLLVAPNFWPLTSELEQRDRAVSAADIAEYLGEAPVELDHAVKRPLFHANRRPPRKIVKKAAPKRAAPKPVFQLQLVGVMGASEASRTAFLLHTGSNETHTVTIGQIVDGWTVDVIRTDGIVLSNSDGQKTLSLSSGG